MASKRKVEIFSAGCPVCQDAIELVNEISCPSCEVTMLDMNDHNISQRAKMIGIRRVPAVVVDGKLADCCSIGAPSEKDLRKAGIGNAI